MAITYKAAVIVFSGVEELDFSGVWQVLGTTQHLLQQDYFETRTVAITTAQVKCAHGLIIVADEQLADLSKYDVIVVPGGPGTREAMKNTQLLKEISRASEAGKLVCSVCTGAFVLAEAGLLKGKKATTYHTELEKLSKYGAVPTRERVVVDRNVVTGAGVSASLDVGLKIIEILLGGQTALKVADWIEYKPQAII